MKIGIPSEVKIMEGRVGLIPAACGSLIGTGHEVYIQAGAGVVAGFSDEMYTRLGCSVVEDAAALFAVSELIIKVKEPQASELALLKPHHLLFGYLHLAGDRRLAMALAESGCTGIAFETVEEKSGELPLLAPMSEIAGRLAILHGGSFLFTPNGGKGVLLGGHAGAERGRVVVIGGGVAGSHAAKTAAAIGAEVIVFDTQATKLASLRKIGANVTALFPYPDSVAEQVAQADLLVGAVLLPGARAPHVVTAAMIETMKQGSVVVDVSVDQGGCIETTRPTTYLQPTFEYSGVIHYGVTNMPGAVPNTASRALSAAIIPYVQRLAGQDGLKDPVLRGAINVQGGEVVHPAVNASLKALQ